MRGRMASSSHSLTVLIIAHNDAATLEQTVERVYRALSVSVEDFGIVVFDDGSTDQTFSMATALSGRYPFLRLRRNEQRLGLGRCIVQAAAEVKTNYVVYVPADNTWLLRSFLDLFGNLGKADVVTSFSSNLLAAMAPAKRLVSRSYTLILNTLFKKNIHYYNGLTIYPVDFLRQGATKTEGFGFQAEALLKAITSGYSFLEVSLPVDVDNLPKARAITLTNVWDASSTIVRLMMDLYFRHPHKTRTPRPMWPVEKRCAGPRTLRIAIMGASSGIGAALARELAGDGHHIYICARRVERLSAVASQSDSIRAYVCDVSSESDLASFVAKLQADTKALDVVINCAGGFGEIGAIDQTDTDRWWRTIEVNLKGTYLIIKHLLPLLTKGNVPRIINLAGGGAFSPFPNFSAYACSKAAVIRLTECLAEELFPRGVRINGLAPGFIATEMHQATIAAGEERVGRMQFQRTKAILEQGPGPMEKVVSCVRRLISPELDELTGKTLSANFDPWQTEAFEELVSDITRSDLYTMRRINVVNLPDGRLRTTLSQPWAQLTSDG